MVKLFGSTNSLLRRDQMALDELSRGHTTVDRLLEISFGEWPPKGLDIIGKNDQPVKLGSMHSYNAALPSEKRNFKAYGKAWTHGERKIVASETSRKGVMYKHDGDDFVLHINSVLGHEAVHILQGDHRNRLTDTFKAKYFCWNLYHCIPRKGTAGFAGEDISKLRKHAQKYLNIIASQNENYYKTIKEVQTHLHQVLAEDYQQSGRLPQNRKELYEALIRSGIKAPHSVAKSVYDISSTTTSALLGNAAPPSLTRSDGNTKNYFQLLQDKMGEREQNLLWKQVLPTAYCDLIEMYGDRQGRARFGLGKNPWVQARLHKPPQPPSVKFANSTFRQATSAQSLNGGIGVALGLGMGLKGIYDKLHDENSAYHSDIQAGDLRKNAAQVGLAGDLANIVLSGGELTAHLRHGLMSPAAFEVIQKGSVTSKILSPFTKLKGNTAVPFIMATAIADLIAAGEARDGHRTLQIVGGAIGGQLAAIRGWEIAEKALARLPMFRNPLAASGMRLAGEMGGALIGSIAGSLVADYVAGDWWHKKLNPRYLFPKTYPDDFFHQQLED